ncbi:Glycerate dehydrogenase [compost metagenome]
MKPAAFLINTARGPLIDESALAEALRHGIIAGASLDVLSQEPPGEDSILMGIDHPNLIITPHVAWASKSSVATLDSIIRANVEGFYNGKPINLIC